jgi:hypothetical protein
MAAVAGLNGMSAVDDRFRTDEALHTAVRANSIRHEGDNTPKLASLDIRELPSVKEGTRAAADTVGKTGTLTLVAARS